MELSPKRERFIAEYPKDLNGTLAAIRAGYAKGSAHVTACRLLKDANVRSRLSAVLREVAVKAKIDASYVIEVITETVDRCRNAVPVYDKEGEETGEYKFESFAVLKGAELLGKHLKMFTDRHEHGFDPDAPLKVIIENIGAPRTAGAAPAQTD